jgi:sensor histidine kinase regulating citrate/malate metabolism
MGLSNVFSAMLFNAENLQGIMTTNDLLNASFDLVNDACVFIDTLQSVTMLNASARLLFNIESERAVGLQIAEFLGT